MRRLALVAVALLPLSAPAGAQRAERVERAGAGSRLCEYKRSQVGPAGQRSDYYTVGLGEPCPPTRPRPVVKRQAAPSLARLAGQRRTGANLICIYEHLGRRYEVSLGTGRFNCPATPNIL